MATVELPLAGSPKTFSTTLAGVTYQMRTSYCAAGNDEGGWSLDIADAQSDPLISGIPLVTGADLLAQYDYMNFGGTLYCITDADYTAAPTYANLGTTSHLYFETS